MYPYEYIHTRTQHARTHTHTHTHTIPRQAQSDNTCSALTYDDDAVKQDGEDEEKPAQVLDDAGAVSYVHSRTGRRGWVRGACV